MTPDISFKLAYTVAKLIDLNTPPPEIASRTGVAENDVRDMETWTRDMSDYSSELGHGAITATETVVLRYIGRWKLTNNEQLLIRMFRQPPIDDTRAREILDDLGPSDRLEMAEALGAEDTGEIAQVLDSLAARKITGDLMGASLLASLYEEDEYDDSGAQEVELLDPETWEGPPSRMVAELLVEEASKWKETPELTLIYRILRKDTLRVLMDTGEFIAILDQVAEQESTGFREDARWPNPGPIYIELTGDLPEIPEEDRELIHSYIISEDSGDGTRMVMIPTDTPDGLAAKSVMLNTRTGEITGLFGEEREWGTAIEMSRRLIAFLTDENYEFVEMPLSRSARRRLQRSGAPNPWHVVQRRRSPR